MIDPGSVRHAIQAAFTNTSVRELLLAVGHSEETLDAVLAMFHRRNDNEMIDSDIQACLELVGGGMPPPDAVAFVRTIAETRDRALAELSATYQGLEESAIAATERIGELTAERDAIRQELDRWCQKPQRPR